MAVERCGYTKIGTNDAAGANRKAHRPMAVKPQLHPSIESAKNKIGKQNGSVMGEQGWGAPKGYK